MKAIVQERYGPPDEVLHLREIDKPLAGDDEVLVQVRATSVHADVWHVVTGLPYIIRLMGPGLRKPANPVPGIDLAGVIMSVGKNVTRFKAGDEVFGESIRGHQWHNGGTYAEIVSAPAETLALKPANISFEQAAAVPVSGGIALFNLQNEGQLKPGQHILINGAGGGVGSLAIQLAKALGAQVTGVDSPEKLALLRSLGADNVIDYTTEDFTRRDERYDLILDVASTLSLSDCKRVLTPAGIYVVIGHSHYGQVGSRMFGNLPHFFAHIARAPFDSHLPSLDFSTPDKQETLARLREFLEAGQLTPCIDKTYPLSEVPAAISYLVAGHAQGKIIITP